MRVRQIVTNGLTNAIKYATPATHGPIRVVCTARGAAESAPTATSERDAAEDGVGGVTDIIKTHITVQILDRGLGLRGQSEAQLFADFGATVPVPRTGAVGSSGLGLAICKRMSGLLGGDLHVRDRDDGVAGTCFMLLLPLQPLTAIQTQLLAVSREEAASAQVTASIAGRSASGARSGAYRVAPVGRDDDTAAAGAGTAVVTVVVRPAPQAARAARAGQVAPAASTTVATSRACTCGSFSWTTPWGTGASARACSRASGAPARRRRTAMRCATVAGASRGGGGRSRLLLSLRTRALAQVPHALAAAAARGPGNGYDAILMDINMARVNGDVACAALRAAGCALPVIAVSGTADDPEYVRRCGFTGVLSKPFSLEQLREALVAHIPAAADAECPPSCQ